MAIYGIQSETDLFVDAITLGTIFVISADHRPLDGVTFHHGNAALVASRVTTVAVKCTGGFGFVDPTVRIGGFHGVAVFCTDPVCAYMISHNQRNIPTASPHSGSKGLDLIIFRNGNAAIGRMVFQGYSGRHDTGSERRRDFFLVTNAATLGRMLGAEPCGLQNARRVVGFSTERGGYIIRHIHTLTALVI